METTADQIHDYLDILIAVLSISGILITVIVWANRKFTKKIVDTIGMSTKNIKTDANGGQSLNDVNKHVNILDEKFDEFVNAWNLQMQKLDYELAAIKRMASYKVGDEA